MRHVLLSWCHFPLLKFEHTATALEYKIGRRKRIGGSRGSRRCSRSSLFLRPPWTGDKRCSMSRELAKSGAEVGGGGGGGGVNSAGNIGRLNESMQTR